ncbi:MAG TPA: hypothetical protein VFE24_01565 [Pirellulales bacterium]|jgi:hypothetical protein|nr:hypothetical protein [Pirellulales bacterium]
MSDPVETILALVGETASETELDYLQSVLDRRQRPPPPGRSDAAWACDLLAGLHSDWDLDRIRTAIELRRTRVPDIDWPAPETRLRQAPPSPAANVGGRPAPISSAHMADLSNELIGRVFPLERLMAIAHYHASQAAIAVLLDVPFERLALNEAAPEETLPLFTPSAAVDGSASPRQIQNMIVAILAGEAATARFDGKAPTAAGAADRELVMGLCEPAGAIGILQPRLLKTLEPRATKMVAEYWSAIRRVATMLMHGRSVARETIAAQLQAKSRPLVSRGTRGP